MNWIIQPHLHLPILKPRHCPEFLQFCRREAIVPSFLVVCELTFGEWVWERRENGRETGFALGFENAVGDVIDCADRVAVFLCEFCSTGGSSLICVCQFEILSTKSLGD